VTYFLDTNIVVFCLRGKSAAAMRRLHAVTATDVRIPLQVHAELLVGATKSANPQRNHARVTAFIAPFTVVWPDPQIEEHYVDIRTQLEARGTPISEADLWIAATTRAAGGTIRYNCDEQRRRVFPNREPHGGGLDKNVTAALQKALQPIYGGSLQSVSGNRSASTKSLMPTCQRKNGDPLGPVE
jgi:tRNA(fMet)-specific endonuclease VapC